MFWVRFETECNRLGKKPNTIAKELHISSGSVTAWKYGGTPSSTTIMRLSEYFGCSADYLIGKTDIRTPIDAHIEEKAKEPTNPLSGLEFALYGELQSLTEDQQLDILEYIRFRKQQWEKRNKKGEE